MINAYPLQWPAVKPRTKAENRNSGLFKNVTVASARENLVKELERIGSDRFIISSNGVLRKDGQLAARQPKLVDPGVAVYFWIKGAFYVLACDTFTDLSGNLKALGSVINRAREVGRLLGLDSMYEVLAALTSTGKPPPHQKPPPREEQQRQQYRSRQPPIDWRKIFGLEGSSTWEAVRKRYLNLVQYGQYRHPDKGGTTEGFQILQNAYEQAKKEFGVK